MGSHDRASPTASGGPARQGASASRRSGPAWSRALRSSGGQLCVSVYVHTHAICAQRSARVSGDPFLQAPAGSRLPSAGQGAEGVPVRR